MGGKPGLQSVDYFRQIALQLAGFDLGMKYQVTIRSKFSVTFRAGNMNILIRYFLLIVDPAKFQVGDLSDVTLYSSLPGASYQSLQGL